MIPVEILDRSEEIFTWQDPDTEMVLHFAVTRLTQSAEYLALPVTRVGILPDYHLWLLVNRGVDPVNAMRLTEEELNTPSALLDMGGDYLLADGTHRVFRLSAAGAKYSMARLVPPEMWTKYLVSGIREQLTTEQILALPTGNMRHRKNRAEAAGAE